jgi:TetR/AcrR family transcriptional repressor of nem operon
MARHREFDASAALDRATEAFWTKGYEATSLDDLCAATGLSRSSLYATFGSKRNLLLLAVDRYAELRTPKLAAALARPVSIRDAIGALLAELIDHIVSGRVGAAASLETALPNFPAAIARCLRGCDRALEKPNRLFALRWNGLRRPVNCPPAPM